MRYELLPDMAEPFSEAPAYDRDDLPSLVERVEQGSEGWARQVSLVRKIRKSL
jgi:hypothetical protein